MAVCGEEEVEDELGVEGPVAGVVEDEDGVDFERGDVFGMSAVYCFVVVVVWICGVLG